MSDASAVEAKWGQKIADRGFAQTPNYLLFINQFIDDDIRLKPVELLVLVQIAATWWVKSEMPFPSIRTLATRCGTSERQVIRALAKLEDLGLIKRAKRRQKGLIASNVYNLEPLVQQLELVADAFPNAFPKQRLKRKAKPSVKASD